MRKLSVAFALAMVLACGTALAANYTLNIDGKDYDLDLDKQAAIKMPDGRTYNVILTQKSIVTFKTDNFSFDYFSRMSSSRTDLGSGIQQNMVMSPVGSCILVQEYSTLNPTSLIDLMIAELTKEEAAYGYQFATSPITKKLADGTVLTGKTVVSSYNEKGITRQILTYGTRDGGLLLVTQIDKLNQAEDGQMIDLFWRTLKVLKK